MRLIDMIKSRRAPKPDYPEFHSGQHIKLAIDNYVIEGYLDGLSFTRYSPRNDFDGDLFDGLCYGPGRLPVSRIREPSTATLTLSDIIVTARRV